MKKKNKKVRNIILIIVDIIIVFVVAYFVLGYLNFYKISKGQEPLFAGENKKYNKDVGIVTVHDYTIYKIVEYKIPNQNITYSMKLWFMDDVK
ncbi:MAG: hypothetical protein ACI4PE_04340 [Bacilli bacterium]